MGRQVVVVGAGLAGVVAARTLSEAGHSVRIYEKSRGYGGRLATRRVGPDRLDHGAPFLVARDPAFRRLLDPVIAAGGLVPWAERLARHDGARLVMDPLTATERRWAAPEGMAAVVKTLAEGLDVRRERRVTAISAENGRWRLTLTPVPEGAIETAVADAVVVAIPGPQARELALTAADQVDPAVLTELARISYEPSLVVLATLDAPPPPWRGLRAETGPVQWIGVESSKRPSTRTTVAIHADPAWAQTNSERPEPELIAALVAEAARIGGEFLSKPLHAELKRWRYARPTLLATARALVSEGPPPLAFCGDWCQGPTAEAAALSGLAAAERLLLARLLD